MDDGLLAWQASDWLQSPGERLPPSLVVLVDAVQLPDVRCKRVIQSLGNVCSISDLTFARLVQRVEVSKSDGVALGVNLLEEEKVASDAQQRANLSSAATSSAAVVSLADTTDLSLTIRLSWDVGLQSLEGSRHVLVSLPASVGGEAAPIDVRTFAHSRDSLFVLSVSDHLEYRGIGSHAMGAVVVL